MPVTKSAKKALRVSERRHEENLLIKEQYKRAIKGARKAAIAGAEGITELLSAAQSSLDTAAKSKTIHANKAARLKSRLAKLINSFSNSTEAEATVKKAAVKKAAAPKKAAAKKPAAKKAATKKTTAKK